MSYAPPIHDWPIVRRGRTVGVIHKTTLKETDEVLSGSHNFETALSRLNRMVLEEKEKNNGVIDKHDCFG